MHMYLSITLVGLGFGIVSGVSFHDVWVDNINGCIKGITCFHGECSKKPEDLGRCICDEGWSGVLCDVDVSSDVPTITSRPSPAANFANSLSDIFTHLGSEQDAHLPVDTANKTESSALADKSDSLNYSVCSPHYTRQPLHRRRCAAGLICSFGTCDMVDRNEAFLTFECRCDPGAIGVLCTHKCCLDCGAHGSCQLFENGTEFCNCHKSYSGEFCEVAKQVSIETMEEANTSGNVNVILVVLGAVALLLIVTSMTLIPYVMWRRRTLAILEFIRCFQRYEDDDYHEWDVLVLFHSDIVTDSFVHLELLPRLEAMSQRACVYTGQHGLEIVGIEEYLSSLVKRSKRLLIVRSSGFLHNFPASQLQLFQDSADEAWNKLITIHLASKSGGAATANKGNTALTAGTLLKYPGVSGDDRTRGRFWRVLELLLPKKREPSLDTPCRGVDGRASGRLDTQNQV